MKPRLLDLFCGAGGATKGYQDAGFYVVGVDIAAQPNYCGDRFIQADALAVLRDSHGRCDTFAGIHASPPCQAYSTLGRMWNARTDHPDLIAETRALLISTGLPYVIENVVGAPLKDPVMLCGSSLGLPLLRRHRLFESNFTIMVPPCAHNQGAKRFPALDAEGRRNGGHVEHRRRLRTWRRQARRPLAGGDGHRLDDQARTHAGDPARLHRTDRPPAHAAHRSGGRVIFPFVYLHAAVTVGREDPLSTEGQAHPHLHPHRGSSVPARHTRSTVRHQPVTRGGTCAPGRVTHLRRLLLGDAPGVLVRVPMESPRRRCRVARAVPVPPQHVRAYAVLAAVDLRSVGERVGGCMVGAP